MSEQVKTNQTPVNQKSDVEKVKEIEGVEGKVIIAKRSNKQYTLRPVSLRNIPKLMELINKVSSSMNDNSTNFDLEMLTAMAEIIKMGLVEEMDTDRILEEFTLGNFPEAYQATLDMNDFLAGMGNIQRQMLRTARN